MPHDQAFTDALNAVDTATNEVAAVVTTLRDTIKTSMTPAEVSAAKDSLNAVAARLKGIAKDPDEPVPEPTPEFMRARGR